MEQAIAEATDDSSRTATFIVWRTRQLLAERGPRGKEPSRATMSRLFSRLSAGRHTTGSAVTRRGLARPQRMFSQALPAAPGELMEIDSTPLDVLVLLERRPGPGAADRAHRRGDQDGARGGDPPHNEVSRRERAPGPCPHARADAPRVAGRASRWRTPPCPTTGC